MTLPMNNNLEAIYKVFKDHLSAIHTNDFDKFFSSLYGPDVQEYLNKIVGFAARMDEFGESEDFIRKLGLKDLEELESHSAREFMRHLLKLITREVGQRSLDRMLQGLVISDIDATDLISNVTFEYPIPADNSRERMKSTVQMIRTGEDWKILFRSGLDEALGRFQKEIDRYNSRRSFDQPEIVKHEGDLIKFTLTGFRDLSTGEVVFEPRFKDAGDFANGLAPVQIMRKYGYIDLKGEISIKPQFIAAKEFSEKLAAVMVSTKGGDKWGFINTKGQMVVEPMFDDTSSFQSGLCAIKVENKWGYVDKKGGLVIPCRFSSAEDFSRGYADVEIEDDAGEITEFRINKKGDIKQIY
jgi:hypothetical protein